MRIGSSLLGSLARVARVRDGRLRGCARDGGIRRAGAPRTPSRLRTAAPGEEPHWFKGLAGGARRPALRPARRPPAGRFESNVTKPVIGVRIAGLEFDHVTGTAAPAMVGNVADAMADKVLVYVFVRFVNHLLTLKLAPASDPVGGSRRRRGRCRPRRRRGRAAARAPGREHVRPSVGCVGDALGLELWRR